MKKQKIKKPTFDMDEFMEDSKYDHRRPKSTLRTARRLAQLVEFAKNGKTPNDNQR